METETEQLGAVRIAKQVLETIIEMAALKEPGVVRLASVGGHFSRLLDREAPRRGIALTLADQEVGVALYLVVESGSNMVQVATAVQDAVGAAIEHMVGLTVKEINVYIQDVA
ncbi:MAG TPA: Asp23/Gls24 family envelope stress response protein [Ktedonobacterales bacterium]